MKLSVIATSFGIPFLVTLAGLAPVAFLGSCDNVTTCGAKTFSVLPIMLIVLLITGFVVGRVSSSGPVGLVAVLAAVALVVTVIAVSGLWYQPPDPDGEGADPGPWLFLAGLEILLLLPGFAIGRSRHDAAKIAQIVAQRDGGLLSPDEFDRQMAKYVRVPFDDQAPPGHLCGRCGKPLSPVWRAKCKHCGASYAEFPPIPRTSRPGR